MYGDYITEGRDDYIIEDEYGFASYRYLGDNIVYIIDIYVVPERRKLKHSFILVDQVIKASKLRGCTKLLGTVIPSAKNSTISLRLLLGHGMKLQSSTNNMIIFERDI